MYYDTSGKLPLDNISFRLFLDLINFLSTQDARWFRYREQTLAWWYVLLKQHGEQTLAWWYMYVLLKQHGEQTLAWWYVLLMQHGEQTLAWWYVLLKQHGEQIMKTCGGLIFLGTAFNPSSSQVNFIVTTASALRKLKPTKLDVSSP